MHERLIDWLGMWHLRTIAPVLRRLRTGDAMKNPGEAPLAGVKFAQGGHVGSGEPIKGRLFLHDHDGHTCEIVAGAHYPVLTADEVRRLGPKLLEWLAVRTAPRTCA